MGKWITNIITGLFIFLSILQTVAQSIHLEIDQDTILVGEPFNATLSCTYPIDQQYLFPDSSFSYHGIEFLQKDYFNTTSNDTTSTDKAVYRLTSFELDSLQFLKMFVYRVTEHDSIKISSDSVPLHLKATINKIPQTIVLKEDTKEQPIQKLINKPFIQLMIVFSILLLIILIILFGKSWYRSFLIFRLKSNHAKFIHSFDHLPTDASAASDSIAAWKKHAKYLTKAPFDTYTTEEIHQRLKSQELNEALRFMDRLIYSNQQGGELKQPKEILKKYSERMLAKRIEKIKNGK